MAATTAATTTTLPAAAAAAGGGRVMFISATFLVEEFDKIPKDTMDDALFFFGSKRLWLFPSNAAEEEESRRQPTKYLSFPQSFKDLVLEKEKRGQVYFLKPSNLDYGDFAKASEWLQSLVCPVTKQNYAPLILDKEWWKEHHPRTAFRVICNFAQGSHEYSETIQLVSVSNPTLRVVLRWEDAISQQ